MSLHEGEENEVSSHHMLEVPLEAAGKDVDNKEIDEEEKIVGNVASHQKRSRKLTEKGQSLKHWAAQEERWTPDNSGNLEQ